MFSLEAYDLDKYNPEQTILRINTEYTKKYPVVYVLYSTSSNNRYIYVGESANIIARLKQHYKNANFFKNKNGREQFIFQKLIIISSKYFNKSSTFNIETNLINYIIADSENGKKSFQIFNVSQTMNSTMHKYYRKNLYDKLISTAIWDKYLSSSKILGDNTPIAYEKVDVLKNRDLFKLSPFKELTDDQTYIKESIIEMCIESITDDKKHVFIVKGAAGTGKSVLLISLFNTLQEISKNKYDLKKYDSRNILKDKKNFFLVQNTDMYNAYRSIGKTISSLNAEEFMKPTSFINFCNSKNKEADVVVIDEGHLLLSEKDTYNGFEENNAIKAIIEKSKITILVFDEKQVISTRKYWEESDLQEMIEDINEDIKIEKFEMEDQFRMLISPEKYDWIEKFLNRKVDTIPNIDDNYDLKIYEDINQFKQDIFAKNDSEGKSRILATYDFPYNLNDKGTVDPGGLNLEWNSYYGGTNQYWMEDCSDSEKEVGSVYSVQGFDLNYVGLFIGPSIGYNDQKQELTVDVNKYMDKRALSSSKLNDKYSEVEIQQIQEKIIMNRLNVLMKRGIKGLYIFAADENLRKKLVSVYNKNLLIK